MSKVEEKKRAIAEVVELMKKYIEYVESVKDQPFTPEISDQLRTRAEKIRSLQQADAVTARRRIDGHAGQSLLLRQGDPQFLKCFYQLGINFVEAG